MLTLICSLHVTCSSPCITRLPGRTIWRHQVHRLLDRLVHRWQEPVPRNRLRCRRWYLRPPGSPSDAASAHQAEEARRYAISQVSRSDAPSPHHLASVDSPCPVSAGTNPKRRDKQRFARSLSPSTVMRSPVIYSTRIDAPSPPLDTPLGLHLLHPLAPPIAKERPRFPVPCLRHTAWPGYRLSHIVHYTEVPCRHLLCEQVYYLPDCCVLLLPCRATRAVHAFTRRWSMLTGGCLSAARRPRPINSNVEGPGLQSSCPHHVCATCRPLFICEDGPP